MKDLKLRDKVRTLLYMIGMVAVLFMAETTIAYATSDDDDLSNSILSEQPVDENRTNIREPGSSENADDLKQLNIANSLTVSYDGGNGELAGTLRILLILTAISLAPILLVTITSFTRILIVLHFTRQALNTTSAPPNQVLIAISLFLTFFIMQPTFSQIYTDAVVPFENGDIQLEEAMDLAIAPMREFMAGQRCRCIHADSRYSLGWYGLERSTDIGIDSKLYHQRAQIGIHNRIYYLHTVYRYRYGSCFGTDEYGYDDASANDNFNAIQDPFICTGRWMEFGHSKSCQNILLGGAA